MKEEEMSMEQVVRNIRDNELPHIHKRLGKLSDRIWNLVVVNLLALSALIAKIWSD